MCDTGSCNSNYSTGNSSGGSGWGGNKQERAIYLPNIQLTGDESYLSVTIGSMGPLTFIQVPTIQGITTNPINSINFSGVLPKHPCKSVHQILTFIIGSGSTKTFYTSLLRIGSNKTSSIVFYPLFEKYPFTTSSNSSGSCTAVIPAGVLITINGFFQGFFHKQ